MKKIIKIITKKYIQKLLISFVFIVTINTFSVDIEATNKICSFTIPIYSDATFITNYMDTKTKVESKSYIVKAKYPPNKIIDFYKSEMEKLKFITDYNDNNTTKNWISYEDESSGEKKLIRQYSQVWINKNTSKKALLVLTYESKNEKMNIEELHVTIQIMPYYDLTSIENFFTELRTKGKYEDFMKLLERYSNDKQNINFEKAINENPDNEDIRTYRDLIKSITQ
jgi:hypothetical protein